MNAPRHPQLMDPAEDPEEFIAASIYWYPAIFPTRTEVLDHTFLCNGNGYEWGEDGKIASVFAHIDPYQDDDTIAEYERDAVEQEARERAYDPPVPAEYGMAVYFRERAAELKVIRSEYLHRARTYGPVRLTEQLPGEAPAYGWVYQARTLAADYVSRWTLLGRAPAVVAPAWQPVLAEVRELFAPLFTEQGRLF